MRPWVNKYLSSIFIDKPYVMYILQIAYWSDCAIKKRPQNQDFTSNKAPIVILADYAAGGIKLKSPLYSQ
jgi:hypothetical protein